MILLPNFWRMARRSFGLWAAALVLSTLGATHPADKKKGAGHHLPPSDEVFAQHQVFRIQIEIPAAGLETLRNSQGLGWNGEQAKRPSAKATVREGTNVYREVAIHLKGAAGSFRPVDSDPALTLNFDKHVKGQTFHGLERISLNNSAQDRSLLNEQVSRELFAKAGVPVPRATHARVQLNGRDLGVYVMVEAFNKQFLTAQFKNPNGNLYDGGFVKDVTDPLEKSSGANPEDRSDLRRLVQAASEPNLTNRFDRLSKVLDMDRFISLLVVDVLTCNWDGYALNRNNYRIYHDPASDRIVFMPHGLDQMFGVMRVGTDMPIFPRMNGLVAHAVMETPEGRQRYRTRLTQLATNLFQVEALTNRVWQLAGDLRPLLMDEGPGEVKMHEREVQRFSQRITERVSSIHDQLAAPDKVLKFDTAGQALLPGWKAKAVHGKPVLDESTEDGRKVLHVRAANGSCVGMWSCRVRLEPGQYRLEGKVKSQGITADPGDRRGGAGLRAADRRFNRKLTGDAPWTEIRFDFPVGGAPAEFGFMGAIQDELPDVELICELRAAKGEAWFDLESLRLVRK